MSGSRTSSPLPNRAPNFDMSRMLLKVRVITEKGYGLSDRRSGALDLDYTTLICCRIAGGRDYSLCLKSRPWTSSLYALLTNATSDNWRLLECRRAVLQPRETDALLAVEARTPNRWSRTSS
jgi:hypothetical protein